METLVYTFPTYVAVLVATLGLALFALFAYFLKTKKSLRAKLVTLFLAVFATGLFAPGLLLDRVELSEQRLTQRTGFWFAPNVREFDLRQIFKIQLNEERDRRGRATQIWLILYRDGREERFDPSDLMENHQAAIFERLEASGIGILR